MPSASPRDSSVAPTKPMAPATEPGFHAILPFHFGFRRSSYVFGLSPAATMDVFTPGAKT